MPTDGSLARWRSRRGLRIAALLAGVCLPAVAAHAQNATWNLNGTGDFNTASNWTPATVPTGTAFFGVSNQSINVAINGNVTIGGWTFTAEASQYVFNNGARLFFNDAGIVNNGSSLPPTIANSNVLEFQNNSSADNTQIINFASLSFVNNSTARNSVINNRGTIDL